MRLQPIDPDTATAAHMLSATDYLTTPREVVNFFVDPSRWEPEVTLWSAAGSPLEHDAGWALFVARLTARDESPPPRRAAVAARTGPPTAQRSSVGAAGPPRVRRRPAVPRPPPPRVAILTSSAAPAGGPAGAVPGEHSAKFDSAL